MWLYTQTYTHTHTHTHTQVYLWIRELTSPDTREHALIELSRKREVLPDLAPMLWHSFGTMAALLQEIVMIYPVINPPILTVSRPVCLSDYMVVCLSDWLTDRLSDWLLSVYLSVCLSVCVSDCLIDCKRIVCLPTYLLSVCQSVCLPTCLLSVCLPACLSVVYLSVCLPTYLSACLPVCCLSVCLPIRDLSYTSPQAQQSNRVCNALALLQCVASHPETRTAFLNGEKTLIDAA